jgi:hypothetical protein
MPFEDPNPKEDGLAVGPPSEELLSVEALEDDLEFKSDLENLPL